MKFCPKCDVRLRRGAGAERAASTCPKCGHTEGGAPSRAAPPEPPSGEPPEFNVLEGDEGGQGSLPTIKIDCEKCGHAEAVWWMLQTRSADEPTTQFYRCTGCGHTWRDYS